MYINFWYPMCTSEELEAKPLRVTLLGMRFALFRDSEGKAHTVSDTCIHRGGSLSKGWIKDDCIVCPYHGAPATKLKMHGPNAIHNRWP